MKIKLTRDSVCMGDDILAPHEKYINATLIEDPKELIMGIIPNYLPKVNGKGHKWNCIFNGRLVCTFSLSGITAKVKSINFEKENSLHFEYISSNF